MPASDTVTIDFKELKHKLMGSDASSPVNCAVALFGGHEVGLLVDKRKTGRSLAVQLKHDAPSSGGSYFFGTAYIDTYPGTLCLNLNKAPNSLQNRVHFAIRGSGFGKVEVTTTGDDDADSRG
jgi:hypothetical protein